jgi:hypothetical protein
MPFGYEMQTGGKTYLLFTFKLPSNFTISKVELQVQHCPITWTENGKTKATGYTRNIKMYKGTNSSWKYTIDAGSYTFGIPAHSTEVKDSGGTNNVLGANGWSGSDSGVTKTTKTIPNSNISTTDENIFILESTIASSASGTNIYSYTGAAAASIDIYGYTKLS